MDVRDRAAAIIGKPRGGFTFSGLVPGRAGRGTTALLAEPANASPGR